MELARTTKLNLNISAEAEVLSYEYNDTEPREVICRVDLGDISRPIAGGGAYILKVYIDDVPVSPSSRIEVGASVTRTVVASRQVPIEAGDVVKVTVTGLLADTGINCVVTLRDSTAAKIEDLVGAGSVEVNHNFGGTDNMTYRTSMGAGIDGAAVQIYLLSDYNAGNTGAAFVAARTTTGPDGRWLRSVMLNPGVYRAVLYKQGAFGPDHRDFTVT